MNDILAITLDAMHHDAARLERIGANLANVLTPGYKREILVRREASAASFATQMARGAPEVVHDPRPGTLKPTGQPLDVALAGPGFFEVATPGGPAYTRRGDFHLDAGGRLTSARGDAVLGEGGEIDLPTAEVTIDATGAVRRDERLFARLKVVRFEDAARLESLGDGLFAAGPGARVVPDARADVRQGFIENANVDSTHEMLQLMQALRHFESMHRVAQGYDDMLGVAIRRLGDL